MYRFAAEKRFARVIVDVMRDFTRDIVSRKTPPAAPSQSSRRSEIEDAGNITGVPWHLSPPKGPAQAMTREKLRQYADYLRKWLEASKAAPAQLDKQRKHLLQTMRKYQLSSKPLLSISLAQQLALVWKASWFDQLKIPGYPQDRISNMKLLLASHPPHTVADAQALLAGWTLQQEQLGETGKLSQEDRLSWFARFKKMDDLLKKQMVQKVRQFEFIRMLTSTLSRVGEQRKTFVLYNATLQELHLGRAIRGKLLYDHLGTTPPLPQIWWADFYSIFLRFLLFLFQLTMPLHIFLILYCQFRLRDPA
ncbi:MAG: hypothetical protein H6728_04625 [Myxococcales bacterium]|nr:hypothetical protein [Myxococcales bacterium]